MSYNYKGINISSFLAGTNQNDTVGYNSFPGTNNIADVGSNYDTALIRPLTLNYMYQDKDLRSFRFAKYSDFAYTTSGDRQSLSPPAGTTHISCLLIGGGGGGGAGGGGNNPDRGGDTAGQPGGGGGSGAQVFIYKLQYDPNFRVIVGGGGARGNASYRTIGNAGASGNRSELTYASANTPAVTYANEGGGGSGGAGGSANADGSFVGSGGGHGNASGKRDNPTAINATTNTGVAGSGGTLWNGSRGEGGAGGKLNKLLSTATDYGAGGQGGTTVARGSGDVANQAHGTAGTHGFCRIYYLIE